MWFAPKRKADEIIGGEDRPYIYRWFIFRKAPFKFLENVYLHKIVRSDDDRALHDHPWWNISIVLWGGYYEHMPLHRAGYVEGWDRRTIRKWRGMGSIIFRPIDALHRLEIADYAPKQTWTIFITGRKCREWGFFCSDGWVHHTKFDKQGCGT